ncbi:MAG: cell wall hydrolase [Eubacteriales bacterium]
MKKILRILMLSVMSAALASVTQRAGAAEPSFETENIVGGNEYEIVVDGYPYDGEVIHVSDSAYVALREFSCMADNAVVSWDEDTSEAYVRTDSLELRAEEDSYYIDANGRILWCEEGLFTYDGKMYVPLRQIAEAFGFETYYSSRDHKTYLTRVSSAIEPDDEFYDEEDLYWLSKIIYAESGGESFLGKLAVGSVVLNRVDSSDFPSTVYDVIFDKKHGVQFTPTVNGAIEKDPDEDSVAAAKICLEDTRLSDDILYFLNEEIATSFWIVENCTYVMTIGCHDFYTE